MKGIQTFKRDHVTQIILCRPWSSQLHPYPSLPRKMRTYLEMKENTTNPLHPNPTCPDRPNTPLFQKPHVSRKRMVGEPKKRNKNHQIGRRQYKVRIIEKCLLLSRASATSATRTPFTTTTTANPPTMSNPVIATATWPLTISTTANLFISNPSNTLRTPHVPNP